MGMYAGSLYVLRRGVGGRTYVLEHPNIKRIIEAERKQKGGVGGGGGTVSLLCDSMP